MKRYLLVLLGFMALASRSMAVRPAEEDLLGQGLWWLYHGRYVQADDYFDQYVRLHPKDPAGYFYKTANTWWELASKLDYKQPELEQRFEAAYQQTVKASKDLYQSTSNAKKKGLASLYWGGAEGMKGRWLVTQKDWVKAYFLGKNGNRLLRQAIKHDPNLHDAYLGLGIYDYFTDTLPGVQGVLAALFIRGDRKRGLEELKHAIDRSEHARVEAMMFLIEIYTSEENTPEKALPLAQALRREFPQSFPMHLTEVSVLYHMKNWPETTREAQSLLDRSQKRTPYYDEEGIRPARYCLGLAAAFGRRDLDLASAYMTQILGTVDSSRWVTFAYLRRGQIYDLRGEREKAVRDYQTVQARADFWGSHKEANRYLKEPFKFPT